MATKILSTDHTVYPLDYDKNGKSGLVEWREYIHTELQESVLPTTGPLLEAKRILTQDARYKTPLTRKQMAAGDLVVYAILFTLAIGTALIITLK